MGLNDFVPIKLDFLEKSIYEKFLKFVKNDLNFESQSVIQDSNLKVDENIRKVEGVFIHNDDRMFPSEDEPFAMTKIFWYNYLVNRFINLLQIFYNENKMKYRPIDTDMDIVILKYENGGHYEPHIDYSKYAPRHISFSYVLNENYEGGEFEFHFPRERVLKIKPKANSCIMFPSNFMFPHKVNPVKKGTRYVVVGWMP